MEENSVRVGTAVRRCGKGGLALVLLGSIAAAQSLAPGRLWSRSSGTEGWSGFAVSLGDAGTQVFTAHGLTSSYARFYAAQDADPPTVQWQGNAPHLSWHYDVASASERGVHVELFDTDVPGNSAAKQVYLRRYSPSDPTHDWTYTWPALTNGHDRLFVTASRDGARIVAVVHNSSTGAADVAVFGPDSGTPIATTSLALGMPVVGIDLSADGGSLLVSADMALRVIALPSFAVRYTAQPMSSVFHAQAISGDGAVFAIGRMGRVDVFRRNTSGAYAYAFSHTLAGTNYCDRLDVSDDGSTLVAGFDFNDTNLKVVVDVVDLNTQATLNSLTFDGSGGWTNIVGDLGVSANGEIVAVGLWGDQANQVPELSFWRRGTSTPLATYALTGSVCDLDLSADGRFCAVGTKAVHATTFDSGGTVELYRVLPADLAVRGVPHAGTSVSLDLKGRPGRPAFVLQSSSLDATPTTFGMIGTLYLSRTSLSILPAGQFDGAGRATMPYTLSTQVGASVYLQAFSSQPRRLGGDWVKVTTVP